MEIVFHAADKGGDTIVKHDLHFQQPKYEALHTVVSALHMKAGGGIYLLALASC